MKKLLILLAFMVVSVAQAEESTETLIIQEGKITLCETFCDEHGCTVICF